MKQFVFAWACVGTLLGLGLFGGYEIPAILLGLFGGGWTLARVQGKGQWPLGKVAQDWSAGILHVLSHLRPPLLLDRRQTALALMALAGLAAILFPPFESEISNRIYHQTQSDGYAFLLTPPSERPYETIRIDYGRLGLECLAILLTGGVAFLVMGSKGQGTNASRPAKDESLLRAVIGGFRGVAQQRGDTLSEADLKRICAFFFTQQENYGLDFAREHLQYELEKYQREGLREDYRAGASSPT